MASFYLLTYFVVNDYANLRTPYQSAHLAYANASITRGELLLGGALADPVDAAILLFRGDDTSVAERFALGDPYVVNGLVTSWTVREWSIVVGQQIFDV